MQRLVFSGLKQVHFFCHASDEALAELAANAKTLRFRKLATIITEGDVSDSLYIVLSGKVRIFIGTTPSKEVILLTQGAGTSFGELSLLTGEPRSASAIALEATVCAVISKCDFLGWLVQNPTVTIELLGMLAGKVRHLTVKVKQLALSGVYERTVNVLMDLGNLDGGMLIIDKRPTQQELASMVGASREMINKVLKELIADGRVVLDGKRLLMEGQTATKYRERYPLFPL